MVGQCEMITTQGIKPDCVVLGECTNLAINRAIVDVVKSKSPQRRVLSCKRSSAWRERNLQNDPNHTRNPKPARQP